MISTIASKTEGAVARPLRVLVPLIKEELELAAQAGMAHYRKAGVLLIEARDTHFEGRVADFYVWAGETFKRGKTAVREWINLVVDETESAREFVSLRDRRRHVGQEEPSAGRSFRRPDWYVPVDNIAERARVETERARTAELTRQQEREADKKLALRLIDIGFKILAKELHPDKGGSRDAMARLNRVRSRLQGCA